MKRQEDAVILGNRRRQGDYFQIDLVVPAISSVVQPGQFVHVRFPDFAHRLMRRPFSVYDVGPDSGRLSIIYKVVGEGTRHLSNLSARQSVNVLGPLGVGFTAPEPASSPIIVAGGYGCAATYLLAKRSASPCRCLLGGRSAGDILLAEEFRNLGCVVEVSTDDGSLGHKGVVTDLLSRALDSDPVAPQIYACGPNPMLKAVADIALGRGLDAEISLDHAMCCGVGACFACVLRMKADTPEGWEYVRTCLDGPVFKAGQAYW